MKITFTGKIAAFVGKALYIYFDLIERIVRFDLQILPKSDGVSFTFDGPNKPSGSIDERIAKIDVAKENLLDSLKAIEELKDAAEKNKADLDAALAEIKILEKDKARAVSELANIKNIANSDIETFQKMAGILTSQQVRKKQLVSFFSGVLASIVAWAVIELGLYFVKNYS